MQNLKFIILFFLTYTVFAEEDKDILYKDTDLKYFISLKCDAPKNLDPIWMVESEPVYIDIYTSKDFDVQKSNKKYLEEGVYNYQYGAIAEIFFKSSYDDGDGQKVYSLTLRNPIMVGPSYYVLDGSGEHRMDVVGKNPYAIYTWNTSHTHPNNRSLHGLTIDRKTLDLVWEFDPILSYDERSDNRFLIDPYIRQTYKINSSCIKSKHGEGLNWRMEINDPIKLKKKKKRKETLEDNQI